MEVILWKDVFILGSLLILIIACVMIASVSNPYKTGFDISLLFLIVVSVGASIGFCTLISIKSNTYTRTDISVSKTDTQYLVKLDGHLLETISTKEIIEGNSNNEDYYLEITDERNLFGKITNSEYVLNVPTTITVIK